MIPQNTGYGLAGFSGFLLFGQVLQLIGWHVILVKLVLLVFILLISLAVFKVVGDSFQHPFPGWIAMGATVFLGLIILGVS